MDTGSVKHFPILVFPNSLEFYLNAREKHKTILTLYNPYTFPVRFSVYCNASNKYTVVDSVGTIGPSCRVDLVVRHIKPTLANCNVIDKFKIVMYDYHTKKTLGFRIIQARLFESARNDLSHGDSEENFEPLAMSSEKKLSAQNWSAPHISQSNRPVNPIAVLIAVISVGVLFIPTPEDLRNSNSYLSFLPADIVSIKLVASFFLGLVTMSLLKP